ncbi:hypothetical protein U5640_16990 [Streptomyces sp. SS7]|uniref:hypothetical protein n=1 Tax=Streptomyces sp. SS7 TaxID=3108485 RepID=UPI0030EE61EF
MTSVTDELVGAGAEAGTSTIPVKAISDAIDKAWAMSISTSTRVEIDATTNTLVGYMHRLQGQALGEDQDRAALQMLRMVERHLSMEKRPTSRTPAHDAFGYLKDTIVFASTLLSLYQKTHERDT